MSKEKISKKLERISRAILEAKTFYEMWWVLCGTKRLKYVDVMSQYGNYSRALITTTFYTTIIALYKVTDKRSHNLEELFEILPSDNFSKEEIKSYRKVLAKHKNIIDAVTILRHNAFGHNSKNSDYKASFRKAGFVPKECRQYLLDLVIMVSSIHSKLGNQISENYFKSNAAHELEKTFKDLMKAKTIKSRNLLK